ncbi:MAG: DUF4150 domain-containing protein [Xanthomonadales bacterium]|nr:DUF4150 domain-containing protein [Xanthomonadales bacterium]
MATHVYANGNEIASKSADGSSKHAFPDICHTPPATASPTPIKPFPPGVPIPYPNSCHASDITNGSRTVFILGKEIALENHSYFSVSEGDDAATKKLAKGIISGAVKGRCFFQTWSPNVKVEGRAVTRHLDLVSHNHKNPSNTALFPYISNKNRNNPCRSEERRIKSACDGVEDDSEEGRSLRRRRTFMRREQNTRSNAQPQSQSSANWRDRHCTGLLGLNSSVVNTIEKGDLNSYKAHFDQIKDQAIAQATSLQNYAALIEREAIAWAERKAIEIGAKALVKQGVGSFLPGVGNAVMGAHTAYELYANSQELAGKLEQVSELITNLEEVDRIAEKASNMSDRIQAIMDGKTKQTASQLAFELMDAQATLDECIRARKCSLVPHTGKSHFDEVGSSNVTPAGGDLVNRGCCPGQTGHHLIPDAMIKTEPGKDSLGCENYKSSAHASAPTVCVEGVNHSQGSHGRMHDNLADELQAQTTASAKAWWWQKKTVKDGAMSMDDAIETAARVHRGSFPLSFCSQDCIEAQLRDFYKKHCPDAKLRVVDKLKREITPNEDSTN